MGVDSKILLGQFDCACEKKLLPDRIFVLHKTEWCDVLRQMTKNLRINVGATWSVLNFLPDPKKFKNNKYTKKYHDVWLGDIFAISYGVKAIKSKETYVISFDATCLPTRIFMLQCVHAGLIGRDIPRITLED